MADEHLEQYRRDGYAVVRGVFGAAEVAEMAAAFDRIYAAGLGHPKSYRHGNVYFRVRTDPNIGRVIRLVLREAVLLLVVGLGIGALLAFWAGRAASTLLFGLKPYDPISMLGAMVALSIVALASSFLPARRAAAVEPMVALRDE